MINNNDNNKDLEKNKLSLTDEELEKILDGEIELSYECNVDVEDVIEKTDYFDKKEEKPSLFRRFISLINTKPYSYVAVTILCLLIGFAGLLIGNHANRFDFEDNKDTQYNEYLKNYEVEIIKSNTIKNELNPSLQEFFESFNLYIFTGIDNDNKLIYFIKYDSDNQIPNIEVIYNNNSLYLTDNNIQILEIKDNYEGNYEYLSLEIIYNNNVLYQTISVKKIK